MTEQVSVAIKKLNSNFIKFIGSSISYLKRNLSLFIFIVFLLPSFIASRSFTDPFESPKIFYFYFFSASLLFVMFLTNLFEKPSIRFGLSHLDISVLLFALYQIIRAMFTPEIDFYADGFIMFSISIVLYFSTKKWLRFDNSDLTRQTMLTILFTIICFGQAVYGILQYFGVLPTLQFYYRVTGAFGNPGPYSNFLALLFPFTVSLFIASNWKETSLKLFGAITILTVFFVLILTKSRSSWIAILVSGFYLLYVHFGWGLHIKMWLRLLWLKIIAVIFLLSFMVTTSVFLFNLKSESASGRMLIWKTTLQMINDKPLFGFGFDKYQVEHNNYQARYFEQSSFSEEEAMLASSSTYAFNEFLQITADTGIVGLAIFLLIITLSFFKINRINKRTECSNLFILVVKASIIAILTSSIFSYPLKIVPINAIFYILLSIVSVNESNVLFKFSIDSKFRYIFGIALVVIVLFFISDQYKRYIASREWLVAYNSIEDSTTVSSHEKYQQLYPTLKYNQYFLYNYGAELSVMGLYKKSNEILKEAELRLNSADLYNYMGNNYSGIGDFENALRCFRKASNIMPVKFYPKYRIVKIYMLMGENDKAIKLAKEIIGMKVKVSSKIIFDIQSEMKELIKHEENKPPNFL